MSEEKCPTCGQEDNPVCSDGYHYESNTPESLEARLEREVVASGIPQEVAVAEHYKAVAEDAIAALKEARADAESWYEQREMMLDSWAEMKQECDEARADLEAAKAWHDQVVLVAKKWAFDHGGYVCTPESIGDFLVDMRAENRRLREKYLDPDCCGMMHYPDCHLLADDPVTNVAPIEGSDGWTDTQDGDEA